MKLNSIFLKSIFLIFTTTLIMSCNDDDDVNIPDEPQPTGQEVAYGLNAVSDPEISGTATVIEMDDGSITVEIQLVNPVADEMHPAHIHFSEDNEIAITLGTVDGDTGFSTINFTTKENGDPITYAQLLEFDGYINVHKSASDLNTLIAQGNIGSNVITYNITNDGDTAYIFNGNSLENESNPDITLKKGNTYKFVVNAPGHPFWIKTAQGATDANAYTAGVTNNGSPNDIVTFVVPASAPDKLYYNCENHEVMTGEFTITD